ncbi:Il26 [Columba livia]|nr:Il26 [Columba livia]
MICKEILYLFCFQTNCSVRHQLLSFYVKNVFSHLGAARDRLYITSAFQVLQANMNACNELVGSGQDAGDTMETSHFPAGDVTLCCSFSTKAATRQGKSVQRSQLNLRLPHNLTVHSSWATRHRLDNGDLFHHFGTECEVEQDWEMHRTPGTQGFSHFDHLL